MLVIKQKIKKFPFLKTDCPSKNNNTIPTGKKPEDENTSTGQFKF
jgi:hypothetical protein